MNNEKNISPMIFLMPSKPRDAKKVVMKTLVRKVVFCSWLIVPAGVKSIPVTFLDISIEENIEDFNLFVNDTKVNCFCICDKVGMSLTIYHSQYHSSQ